ncbi:hypothetical protein F5Y14DRAFT_408328 [Nemania sp. NC0429]|nr:hypothetical protein F5Y14DRAFT_408328 [Nemania sp. NC0429]
MASHPSTTPAKVPASAATYTPATQDVDLRSQINTILLREGYATKIQEYFLHSLDAHSSNWPSAIQSHALALLRSGEVNTFPALVRRVLDDVQRDAASASNPSSTANNQTPSANANEPAGGGGKDGANGAAAVNGVNKAASGANGASAGADSAAGLAIPTAVVEAVLKVVRESLEAVCEIEPDGSAGG